MGSAKIAGRFCPLDKRLCHFQMVLSVRLSLTSIQLRPNNAALLLLSEKFVCVLAVMVS
jgi:hypothetical protein